MRSESIPVVVSLLPATYSILPPTANGSFETGCARGWMMKADCKLDVMEGDTLESIAKQASAGDERCSGEGKAEGWADEAIVSSGRARQSSGGGEGEGRAGEVLGSNGGSNKGSSSDEDAGWRRNDVDSNSSSSPTLRTEGIPNVPWEGRSSRSVPSFPAASH